MKTSHILIGAVAALSLAACGGGGDSSGSMSTPPPTGGTPSTPATPAPADFSTYAVTLAKQQDAASEKAAPESLDNTSFAFDESSAAFASVFPAN